MGGITLLCRVGYSVTLHEREGRGVQERIVDEVAAALREAKSVVVLTGAGVSAESGIPTFRDAMEGLWEKFDPMELATPEAFDKHPRVVARWYDERRLQCASCKPNPGHAALAEMERRLTGKGGRFTLLTQNVDGLHQAAGSANVAELHGSIWRWRCLRCGLTREERGGAFDRYPPRCECGGWKRPAIVWFGEGLPEEALAASERAFRSCDLFFSVVTSAVVQPSASFIHVARSRGAKTVEVNREPTPITRLVDWSIRGKSGEVLPALVARTWGGAEGGT